MTEFLKQQYEEARTAAFNELAYMLRQIDEYAEQNGGEAALSEEQSRIYHGRKRRIQRLVGVHDRAQEYIESLEEWIDELIHKNRRLAADLRDHNTPAWERLVPGESREWRREQTILRTRISDPHLY